MRKPKVGMFMMCPESFAKIGEGTRRGTYEERKQKEADAYIDSFKERVDVFFPGIVWNHQDVRNAIRLFTTNAVDCVLVCYLSWAKDFTLNRFLRDMIPVPILYAWVQRSSVSLGDTHDEDEFAEYLCCGGLVGTLEGSGDFARYNRPMVEMCNGTWDEVKDNLIRFATAAAIRNELKDSHIGLLASYNEIMWSTYVDPYSVFMQVGPELHFLSVAELADKIETVRHETVDSVRNRLAAKYEVRPDVEEEKMNASIRASIAMEQMAEDHQADLLVLNDVDSVLFDKVGLRPGFYPTDENVRTVIVPEGDVGAGIAALILKKITEDHVYLIEPFHVDLPSDTFEGGHAGPNDYTDKDGKTQIARDVRFAKTKYKYAGAPFAWHVFPKGQYTMLHVSQRDGRFVLALTLVEALDEEAHLATYSHGRFKPVHGSCKELFGQLMKLGVTQHYALVRGDVRQTIMYLGRMLNFECHEY